MIEDALAISSALRNQHELSDSEFDRLFPHSQRFRSHWHWTPLEVALRACALLAPQPGQRVLDVGSGVGKVCLVGAVTTRGLWVGVETDAQMIRAAEEAARRLDVAAQIQFVHGDATEVDWSDFDAIYMFNPFAESLFRSDLDAVVRRDRYNQHVERAQQQLANTRDGTRLVTYHGFGGQMPEGFELVHREPAHEDQLCLWIRMPG